MEHNHHLFEKIIRMRETRISRRMFNEDLTASEFQHDRDYFIQLFMNDSEWIDFIRKHPKVNLMNEQIRVVSICIFTEKEEKIFLSISPCIYTYRLLINLSSNGYRKISRSVLKYLWRQGNSVLQEFNISGVEISK